MPASTPRIMMISTHGYVAAVPELGKPDTGGQVVYVLELAKCLGQMGFQVDILTRGFEEQPLEEELNDQVRVLRFPCGGDEFIPKEFLCDSIPEWVEHVLHYVTENEIEYSFINSHYWDAGLAGQLLSQQLEIPHLHTPHSIGSWKRDNMEGLADDPEEKERRYNFVRRIRDEQWIYDSCGMLIATTLQQRDVLRNSEYNIDPTRIRVIPPGYDDRRFFPVSSSTRDAIRNELKLSGRIVLALGRMARNKGYDLLIRSMVPVCQRLEDVRLLLAAGSTQPSDDELQQLQSLQQLAHDLNLTDRVLFRDYIPDEQLPDYYRAADVFALSSRYEPFGMTAVEAMACGTPTVITTEGGLWELITWGVEALYANPNDSEAFGHTLLEVLQYPQIAGQLASHGASRARANFTWTGVAQQIISVFHELSHTESPRSTPAPVAAVLSAEATS